MNESNSGGGEAEPSQLVERVGLAELAKNDEIPAANKDGPCLNELEYINLKIIELNEKFLILHKKWFLERKTLVYSSETKNGAICIIESCIKEVNDEIMRLNKRREELLK